MIGIPRATLINNLIGVHNKTPGGKTVQRGDEERSLAETLTTVATWRFPLTEPHVQTVVKKYLDKKVASIKIFKDNLPVLTLLMTLYKKSSMLWPSQNFLLYKCSTLI